MDYFQLLFLMVLFTAFLTGIFTAFLFIGIYEKWHRSILVGSCSVSFALVVMVWMVRYLFHLAAVS